MLNGYSGLGRWFTLWRVQPGLVGISSKELMTPWKDILLWNIDSYPIYADKELRVSRLVDMWHRGS